MVLCIGSIYLDELVLRVGEALRAFGLNRDLSRARERCVEIEGYWLPDARNWATCRTTGYRRCLVFRTISWARRTGAIAYLLQEEGNLKREAYLAVYSEDSLVHRPARGSAGFLPFARTWASMSIWDQHGRIHGGA